MKLCRKCSTEKPLDEFHKQARNSDGLQAYCKPCNHLTSAESVRVRREKLQALKDVPCMDCGVKYPPYVMDFDHRDGSLKEFTISKHLNRAWKEVLAEVEKCDVVCANCHRIRTFSRREEDNGTL